MTCAPLNGVTMGAWVRLPSAAECSASSNQRASAGSQLLGWATTPDFPVDMARDRIENDNDDVLELRSDDGQLTAVFIPACGWTHITGDSVLYPIWS